MPTMIMSKDKQNGGSKPPPYVGTDIFLCIYCEFRICLTNASGYAHALTLFLR